MRTLLGLQNSLYCCLIPEFEQTKLRGAKISYLKNKTIKKNRKKGFLLCTQNYKDLDTISVALCEANEAISKTVQKRKMSAERVCVENSMNGIVIKILYRANVCHSF